jgi:4-hydroxy-tetrahydrodipicolinate reductase
MNIALIGYGKMGKTIEQIAIRKGHTIIAIVDKEGPETISDEIWQQCHAVIEFTEPSAAYHNISFCLTKGVPVVSGTTGWLERKPEIEALCKQLNGAFFHATNYSIGVNLFFYINAYAAKLMNNYPEFEVEISEIHHTEKKDSPSGTAITIAQHILKELERKKQWVQVDRPELEDLNIISHREPGVPGTHAINWYNTNERIELKHIAHNRDGFAMGAVFAAEWIVGKKGNFGMADLLGL